MRAYERFARARSCCAAPRAAPPAVRGEPSPFAAASSRFRAERLFESERARRERARWDEQYEALGEILDGDPPLYLAGGYANEKAFLAAALRGVDVRSARRSCRVARFFDADDEAAHGVMKLDTSGRLRRRDARRAPRERSPRQEDAGRSAIAHGRRGEGRAREARLRRGGGQHPPESTEPERHPSRQARSVRPRWRPRRCEDKPEREPDLSLSPSLRQCPLTYRGPPERGEARDSAGEAGTADSERERCRSEVPRRCGAGRCLRGASVIMKQTA